MGHGATTGPVYSLTISSSFSLMSLHALDSRLPCTVMRTRSAPASAHLITCGPTNTVDTCKSLIEVSNALCRSACLLFMRQWTNQMTACEQDCSESVDARQRRYHLCCFTPNVLHAYVPAQPSRPRRLCWWLSWSAARCGVRIR